MNSVEQSNASSTPTFYVSRFGTEYNGRTTWIACQVVLLVLTVLLCYICVCAARFAWLVYKSTKKIESLDEKPEQTGITDEEDLRKRAKFTEGYRSKYKRMMVYLCFLATVVTLAKFMLDQLKFFYIWNARSDELCEFAQDFIDIFMFFVAFISVYGFLWMKQWVFYRDPKVIGILYSRKLVNFSKIFIACLMIVSAVVLTVNMLPKRYAASNSTAALGDVEALANDVTYLGCVSVYDMAKWDDSWPMICYAIVSVVQQATLLGLFIYPLLKHRRDAVKLATELQRTSVRSISDSSVATSSQKKTHFSMQSRNGQFTFTSNGYPRSPSRRNRLKPRSVTLSKDAVKTTKRAVMWTALCIFTDQSLFVVFALIGPGVPLILVSLAQDIDLFFNIFCLIGTYNTWQNILFPLCAGDDVIGGRRSSTRKKSMSVTT